eukprot:XP_001705479.1 Hypothetical protein GL50803_31692 [Giardia lamblia ATCC 50803]
MDFPNCLRNVSYLSLSSSRSLKSLRALLMRFLRIVLTMRFFWSISREMFSGRSSQSTTPLRNVSQSGTISVHSSVINLRVSYREVVYTVCVRELRLDRTPRATPAPLSMRTSSRCGTRHQ